MEPSVGDKGELHFSSCVILDTVFQMQNLPLWWQRIYIIYKKYMSKVSSSVWAKTVLASNGCNRLLLDSSCGGQTLAIWATTIGHVWTCNGFWNMFGEVAGASTCLARRWKLECELFSAGISWGLTILTDHVANLRKTFKKCELYLYMYTLQTGYLQPETWMIFHVLLKNHSSLCGLPVSFLHI